MILNYRYIFYCIYTKIIVVFTFLPVYSIFILKNFALFSSSFFFVAHTVNPLQRTPSYQKTFENLLWRIIQGTRQQQFGHNPRRCAPACPVKNSTRNITLPRPLGEQMQGTSRGQAQRRSKATAAKLPCRKAHQPCGRKTMPLFAFTVFIPHKKPPP